MLPIADDFLSSYTKIEAGYSREFGIESPTVPAIFYTVSDRPYFSVFVSQSIAYIFFIPLYVPVS